mgnify:CR=1 FL=1
MVDPAPVVAVPLRLRLVPVHLDGQAVHVEGQPPGPLAAALGARRPGAEFERRLAQHRPVGRLGHDGGEARQRGLRGQAMGAVERRAPGRRTGRQPEGGIVPERVRVVVVAPALGGEQDARPDQRGEVMDDILLAPRIRELWDHPLDDAALFHDLAQDHGPGVPGQALGAALDPERPVEARDDRL